MPGIFDHIELNQLQKSKKDAIVEGILAAIAQKTIAQGDSLPSVNMFIQKLGVARMTVVKALNILKERGIIISEDKVGYFVKDVNVKRELKVFLFLSGFNTYHETLYNSIIEQIDDPNITIDLYFHHCNPKAFKSILHENLGAYGLYVVTVFDDPLVKTALAKIPSRKLLQIIRPPLLDNISAIYQDFYAGLKDSLEKLKRHLAKYEKFVLIFPSGKGHPEEIKTAFWEFCVENNIDHSIEKKITAGSIAAKTAYWVIEDSDLISLIKYGENAGLTLGENLGIISYNETSMKEIIRNGITVISADFNQMGCSISHFISNPVLTTEVFTPDVIIRKSL